MDNEINLEKRLVRKILWRMMPLVALCYMAAVVDRSNVGFAKLQMLGDLHMTEIAYGLGASLYFIGYLLFEVPSTLVAYKNGVRLLFARIMVTWGAATVLLGFVTSVPIFYALRFILGAAEAGLYPSAIYFVTLWFPLGYRTLALSFVQVGGSIGNIAASLMAGPLLDLNGFLGVAGWRWVFIGTGVLPLVLAVLVYFYLANSPREARFLAPDEKSWLMRTIEPVVPEKLSVLFASLLDGRIAFFCVLQILLLTALYGQIYWLPTVIKGFGGNGTATGLLSAVPYMFALIIMLTVPAYLKTSTRVLRAISITAGIGVLCFAISVFAPSNQIRFVALVIGAPCIQMLIPCFWFIATDVFLGGAKRAMGIAAISTVGTLGGFFAQNLMPWVAHLTGNPPAAMLVPASCLFLLALSPVVLSRNTYRARPVLIGATAE
jgi:MFS family permease